MKTLFLDCNMGAAGDMLAGALLELTGDPDGFIREMNEIGLAGVSIAKENSFKCGIGGDSFPCYRERRRRNQHGCQRPRP